MSKKKFKDLSAKKEDESQTKTDFSVKVIKAFNVQRNGYTFIHKTDQIISGEHARFLVSVNSPVVEI